MIVNNFSLLGNVVVAWRWSPLPTVSLLESGGGLSHCTESARRLTVDSTVLFSMHHTHS